MNIESILLPYQKEWVQDVSPVKFYEKSRRIGITWAEALDNVLTASADNGMDIWYIGYNKDMAREYIETCADWSKKINKVSVDIYSSELIDEDKKILQYSITFNSGYKITALSGRPSNLRGKQGKAVIDEAAFHEDLQETMKAALAFLIWGGSVVVISTHNGEESKFNGYIKDIKAGRKNYSLHRTTFDDAINYGLYERVKKITKINTPKQEWIASIYADYGDSADEELRCIPARSGGAYFSSILVENSMVELPIIRIDAPDNLVDLSESMRKSYTNDIIMDDILPVLDKLDKNLNYYVGVDFARTADLSVFWILQENKNLVMHTPFIIELRNTPFEVQKDILHFILKYIPKFSGIALDARGNGAYLAEITRQVFGGARVLEVQATEKFYLNSFPKLKARFEDKSIIIPRDANILNDFRAVKIIKGIPKITDVRTNDIKGKRHGDSAIACLLANYARDEIGIYEAWDCVSVGNIETKKIYEEY